jgi:hypothetical protein
MRLGAFRRLGHDVEALGFEYLWAQSSPLVHALWLRLLVGPAVDKINRVILRRAYSFAPQIVWFDKALPVRRSTVEGLRQAGIFTVHFNPDNPFGPRNDPGWRLFLKALPAYDLHIVPRPTSLEDYQRAGARRVELMEFGIDPVTHFPPPVELDDAERPIDVSFIGFPYDDRADFFSTLAERFGIPITIRGYKERWRRALPPERFARLWVEQDTWGDNYRRAIWQARINLCLITKSNCDVMAGRTFEVAACGGFILAERTSRHLQCFREDEEAVFFSSLDECAAKIRRWLPDAAGRARISAAAHVRTATSGYTYDARIASVLAGLDGAIAHRSLTPYSAPEPIPA